MQILRSSKLQKIGQRVPFLSTTTFSPTDPFSAVNVAACFARLENVQSSVAMQYLIPKGKEVDGRKSAVLIPFCYHEHKPSILFTLRSNRLTRHKGYVCFPGGVSDPGEENDPVKTALREAHEELNIQSNDVNIWGCLPTVKLPRDAMYLTGVLGFIGDIDNHVIIPNPNEVHTVFTRSLEELCDPNNVRYTIFRIKQYGQVYATPAFLAGQFQIWGITAMILDIVLRVLVPDRYKNRFSAPLTHIVGYSDAIKS